MKQPHKDAMPHSFTPADITALNDTYREHEVAWANLINCNKIHASAERAFEEKQEEFGEAKRNFAEAKVRYAEACKAITDASMAVVRTEVAK